MKHEIKTEEHYNFLKSYFTFNTPLEDYLKSSSQVIVRRFSSEPDSEIIGILSYGIVDGKVKIYYIAIQELYRRKQYGCTMIEELLDKYQSNTKFTCSIRETNLASIAFFKTFQFKEVDKARYSDGENKIIMERDGA